MKTLFGFSFGANYSPGAGAFNPVTTSAFSQPHVLRRRMEEEKMTHAETVTANISPVRLEKHADKMVMYFCPMKSIEIIEKIAAGDGCTLPSDVIVEGITIPDGCEAGLYTLKNVVIGSNGTLQVIARENTAFEKYTVEVVA